MLNSLRPTFLALVASLTASQTVQAAEWIAEPTVNLREEFNDNYRLTAAAHDNVWGTILDPRLKLRRRSDLWDMSASGRLRAANYTGEDGLNTVDNFFDVAAKRHLERGSLNAKASLINDTTLQTEELDFDTGVINRQIDRMRRNLSVGGEYMFTETNWVEASLDYEKVSYNDDVFFSEVDYDTLTPEVRLVHQYNLQTQVFGTLSHSEIQYDNLTDQESKTDSLQLGAAYDITETWNVSASVGSQRTRTSNVLIIERTPVPVARLGDTESTGLVYDASLSRKFETGSLSLSASQSVQPSSDAVTTESTRITLNGDHRFSTKLSADLAVSYYKTAALDSSNPVRSRRADRDRYRIAPSLSWHMDEDLTLNTGYTYTRVERDTASGDTTDSNAVFVSLGYSWPRMSMSR